MRLIVQFLTQSLQKRTDRLIVPNNCDTENLIHILSKRYNTPVNRINVKFKRDGYNVINSIPHSPTSMTRLLPATQVAVLF